MFAIYLSLFCKHISFSVWHPMHVKHIQPIHPGYVGPTGNTQISAPLVFAMSPSQHSLYLTLGSCDAAESSPTPIRVLSTCSTCSLGDPRVPGLQRWLPHQTPQTGDFAGSCPANSVSTASKTIGVWYLQVDLKEKRKRNNN